MKYLLGIDIGTSGTKTVLFDTKGRTVASASADYPLYQPKNGWAEQDPLDWWNATVTTVSRVLSGVDPDEIAGVGLSGQMHGLVLLDKSGKILRKSIIWCDQRTSAQCEYMTKTIGKEALIKITGNPALTGFTASKILWVRDNEPEIYDKTAKILLPKDYIRYMLTGEFATEVSDAGGMQLLDIGARKWSKTVLNALKIDPSLLADVYESYEVSGKIQPSAAGLTGLKPGTPVVGGGGDQAAGAVGNGIVRTGVMSCSLGTSGVIFASTDEMKYDPQGRIHTFCHAVPNTWHVMGVAQASGLSLKWFRDNFCEDFISKAQLAGTDPYFLMDREAAKKPIGANGLIFLPYLMGERTPHLDADCRGVFFGLSAIHDRVDMIRAIMEGVAFSQADCLRVIREVGIEPNYIRISGGGSRSELWRQMHADCLNTDITTTNSSEGPALGVALLAAVGTGVYSSVAEACDAAITDESRISPQPESAKKYAAAFNLYRNLYSSLKDDFKTLANLSHNV